MSKKILVVEDYDDIRKMMKILLEMYGYEVFEAADGYEAVKTAVEERPDLIFMDIAMPSLDGVQATSVIRQHPTLKNVPILAVTAYSDFYDEKARQAGCDNVIPKPLNLNELKPLVRQYLGN